MGFCWRLGGRLFFVVVVSNRYQLVDLADYFVIFGGERVQLLVVSHVLEPVQVLRTRTEKRECHYPPRSTRFDGFEADIAGNY